MSPSDQPGSTPPAGSVPPELDPRLKGLQASPSPSPSPSRAPLPVAPMVLGGGVLLTVAILVFGRGGEEEPAPKQPVPAAAVPVAAEPEAAKPLVGKERPEIRHAEAWEQTAEALGFVEKHLNRAQLIFGDIDVAMAKAEPADNQLRWRGGAGNRPPEGAPMPPDGAAPGEAPPPDGQPQAAPPPPMESPNRVEARELWNTWRSDFERDLESATSMLPKPGDVDPALLPGYSAVAELIARCRQIPPGSPPSKPERSAWLNSRQNKAAAVRRTLENAR